MTQEVSEGFAVMLVNHCAHEGAANTEKHARIATYLENSMQIVFGRPMIVGFDSGGVPSCAVSVSCSCL
jgi:hypothetical protein